MKHIFSFLITFLLLTNLIYAQEGWFWENPLPTGNTLYDIHFANLNKAYIVLKLHLQIGQQSIF